MEKSQCSPFLVLSFYSNGIVVQLRAERVRCNTFHEKFTPVKADVAAAGQERSIIRQASMRTLSDPHWGSVQVEVRPVGRCYLVQVGR